MHKPITLPEELQAIDFDKLYKQEKHARVKPRLLAMAHLKGGMPYKQVAQAVRVHEKTVLKWIRQFKAEGLEGLQEKGGRGAQPRLKPEQYGELKARVLAKQDRLAGGRMMGKDVQKVLKEDFGIELQLSAVYNMMHASGLSWVSSRSRHPKADAEKQADFKKLQKTG